MLPRKILLRRLPALALMVLITALSLTVPLLDRELVAEYPAISAEQSESTPGNGHDHLICVQFNANQLAHTETVEPLGSVAITLLVIGWSETVVQHPPADPIHRTRAPPQA